MIKSINQNNNYNNWVLMLAALFIVGMLTMVSLVGSADGGVSSLDNTLGNDTLTTPLPGNCESPCPYPDCGKCGGEPAITLQATEIIGPLPTMPIPATPFIPTAVPFNPPFGFVLPDTVSVQMVENLGYMAVTDFMMIANLIAINQLVTDDPILTVTPCTPEVIPVPTISFTPVPPEYPPRCTSADLPNILGCLN